MSDARRRRNLALVTTVYTYQVLYLLSENAQLNSNKKQQASLQQVNNVSACHLTINVPGMSQSDDN